MTPNVVSQAHSIERYTKLILAWHVGHRTYEDTVSFTDKLAHATSGSFQVITDGFAPYRDAVLMSLGMQRVSFAQLIKIYRSPVMDDTRYSPAECTGCRKEVVMGQPDMDRVSTSIIERHNLSVRMENRRFTANKRIQQTLGQSSRSTGPLRRVL